MRFVTRALTKAAATAATPLGLIAALAFGCAHAPASAPHAGTAAPAAVSASSSAATRPSAATTADSAAASVAWADHVRSSFKSMRKVDGMTDAGGTTTNWSAYFEGDSLRGITEHMEFPDYTPHDNEYFLDRAELRVFTSTGPNALTGSARERGPFVLSIEFAPGGRVVGSHKTVSGTVVAIEDFEVAGVLNRASWLVMQVRQSPHAHAH
jgi:hypothetical protein